jgi:dTDP-4-amino-4,6-dideoxygalactose transaminase
MKIAAQKHHFSPSSIEFILTHFREILEGKSFLSMYKHGETFEKSFATYTGTKFAASCNSGTSALEIILRAVDIKGYDVIVPTMTFAATAYTVVNAGGQPIFADCTPDMTVDPEDVKKRLTPKTKAIMTVHIGGLVSPHTEALLDLCKEKGLLLIEDAAHAHGSTLNGKKAGSFGIAGGFSFFSTKVMTTGEGGMITTHDSDIYNKSLLLRNHAKINNANYHREFGYNWRMAEVEALMGIAQLNELESFIQRRNEIAKIYDEKFPEVPQINTLKIPARCRSNFYKYIAFLPPRIDRDLFHKKMKVEYNVAMGGSVYEVPCHLQPVFKEFVTDNLPVSEDLAKRHICPPSYYSLTDEEAKYVVDSIRRCLA